MLSKSLCLVLMVLGVIAAALAPQAMAATAAVAETAVVFEGAPGEVNNIRISFGAGNVVFQDATAPTPGRGCVAADFNGVSCDRTATTAIVVRLNDGNDQMSATPSTPAGMSFRISGGTGADTLWGGRGNDKIEGGAGNDLLYGQGGRDVLEGGAGKDRVQGQGTLKGGRGSDFIDALFGDDGSRSIVSHLFGGSGNDHFITGNGAKDIVDCGPGNDQVTRALPTGRRDRRDRARANCEHRL